MAKRKYKRNMGARQPPVRQGELVRRGELVRLSQCMIVKNEERNIERALSWGRSIVCEQIVVDTGSTDRTVEIAESMGAKVLHFAWINDFAAAKNFAIEQCSGNWIAFLDADEYIEKEEVGTVVPLLEIVMSDPRRRNHDMAVCCPWIQLNDKGQPKEILEQERIFQNRPNVRYAGKIHEALTITERDIAYTFDFRIMHTGYTAESFTVTGKASRNIELLRAQLAENPGDMTLKAYLAESLRAEAGVKEQAAESEEEALKIDKEYFHEVDKLYSEVLEHGIHKIPPLLQKSTYEYFLRDYTNKTQINPEMDKLCERAHKEFPKDTKFMCYYAMSLNKNGRHKEAFDILKKCEEALVKAAGSSSTLTTKVMSLLTAQMVLAAQGLGDVQSVLAYAEIMLLMEKDNMSVLRPYIYTILNQNPSLDDAMGTLGRVYDLSSKRDLLTIARAAKDCGAIDLARRIVEVAAYLGDN